MQTALKVMYKLKFNYSEGDSGSYWYYIVIGGDTTFEFSEAWELRSTSLMLSTLWEQVLHRLTSASIYFNNYCDT